MRPGLYPFTVIWVDKKNIIWRGFNCWAEDSDQAQEQCENTHPDGDVIWVNQGHDNFSMEELEVPYDDSL